MHDLDSLLSSIVVEGIEIESAEDDFSGIVQRLTELMSDQRGLGPASQAQSLKP